MFSIKNGVGEQSIESFNISVSREPGRDGELSDQGLTQCSDAGSGIKQKMYIIPVGSAAPQGWSCRYMPHHFFAFSAIQDGAVIKGGKSESAFKLFSYGLPGIRSVNIEPDIDVDKLPSEWAGDLDNAESLSRRVSWSGKTIGPQAPPRILEGPRFLEYITELYEQCLVQKWLTEGKVGQDLETQLEGAKKRLAAKDAKGAKAALKTFLEYLKDQNGKALTPEAFALLYYNTQYLVDHL
jgi:hypothetical protein